MCTPSFVLKEVPYKINKALIGKYRVIKRLISLKWRENIILKKFPPYSADDHRNKKGESYLPKNKLYLWNVIFVLTLYNTNNKPKYSSQKL